MCALGRSKIMEVREHKGFSHGLRPGAAMDISCPSCQREDTQAEAEDALATCRRVTAMVLDEDSEFDRDDGPLVLEALVQFAQAFSALDTAGSHGIARPAEW
jgi:hypothetical protein